MARNAQTGRASGPAGRPSLQPGNGTVCPIFRARDRGFCNPLRGGADGSFRFRHCSARARGDYLAAKPDGGLIVLPDVFTVGHRDLIIGLAARHRVPAVYPLRAFAVSGGLISDSGDTSDILRRTASYVDRILKGAKPDDLPVQSPTKFELVINLKTAKSLGLEIPPMLLARADEVIE